MAVHRVGPELQPLHRIDLGHVLVTTDDLDALMALLAKPDAAEVQVDFVGGSFTKAEDLPRLSNEEMTNLSLRTPTVQVILDKSYAFAIGERQEVESIYRLWARSRQTRQKSDSLRKITASAYIASAGAAAFP